MAKKTTTKQTSKLVYRVPVLNGKRMVNLANELMMSDKDFENAKEEKYSNMLILSADEFEALKKEVATNVDLAKENAELKKQLAATNKPTPKTDVK